MEQAKVVSINRSIGKGTVKQPIQEGLFIVQHGLDQDAHAGNWHRQVSLLSIESIDYMKSLGIDALIPGSFAENITTIGITLHTLPIGTRLKIGETLQEVSQIGKTCHTNCAIFQKVGQCIMPTEGIFTKVIQGGLIKEGDLIEVL